MTISLPHTQTHTHWLAIAYESLVPINITMTNFLEDAILGSLIFLEDMFPKAFVSNNSHHHFLQAWNMWLPYFGQKI